MNLINLRDVLPRNPNKADWDARPATSQIVVHHTAGSANATPQAIAHYQVWQRPPVNGKDVTTVRTPYHLMVGQDGYVYLCNDLDARTWHAGGGGWTDPQNANHYSLAVCLIGDFTHVQPSIAQLAAAREVVEWLRRRYGPLTVIGHRAAYKTATACPGDTYREWLSALAKEDEPVSDNIGWHGGNGRGMTDVDREVIRRVPPACYWFLPDEGISPDDIRWVLAQSPQCHVGVRPYYSPRDVNLHSIQEYIDQCRRAMDAYGPAIPAQQRHLQVFNEQNMPKWAQWEGFGDTLPDMQRFNEAFVLVYNACKQHNPTWRIGWTPLTPGNRDAWFKSDAVGHYYMHGPSGCATNLSPAEVQRAIAEGPCRDSLGLADEYYAHVYVHEARDAYRQPYLGLRFERYRMFLPKTLKLWITECGHPSRSMWPTWGDQAIVDWYGEIRNRNVAGTALWILGDNPMWGVPMEESGQPRPLVGMLADWRAQVGTQPVPQPVPPPVPPPATEPLPEHETATDMRTLTDKVRWWFEEYTRQVEAGNLARAEAIRYSLITLMYRLENAAK